MNASIKIKKTSRFFTVLFAMVLALVSLLFIFSCKTAAEVPGPVPHAQTSEKTQAEPSMAEVERFESLRENMVKTQIVQRGISDPTVIDAMLKVPRHLYVDDSQLAFAYNDRPLPIGEGQTISQPYIVALMTQSLELSGDEKVLEIGTGSGYQAAILAEIVEQVYTVEIIPSLYELSKNRLAIYDNTKVSNHDGYYGWEEYAPFDRIIVTAAPDHVPQPLLAQLKDGGIMVLPVGPAGYSQTLYKITKEGQTITLTDVAGVIFVPLTRSKD